MDWKSLLFIVATIVSGQLGTLYVHDQEMQDSSAKTDGEIAKNRIINAANAEKMLVGHLELLTALDNISKNQRILLDVQRTINSRTVCVERKR